MKLLAEGGRWQDAQNADRYRGWRNYDIILAGKLKAKRLGQSKQCQV